jgi:hypothetical protein
VKPAVSRLDVKKLPGKAVEGLESGRDLHNQLPNASPVQGLNVSGNLSEKEVIEALILSVAEDVFEEVRAESLER